MLSISTAYWPSAEEGDEILDEADRLGFGSIELSSYTGRKPLEEMLPALRQKRLQVVSLHNPCPKYEPRLFPWEVDRPEPLLTATDREEREAALRLAEKTMELAADLEARALVLHLGQTDLPPQEEWLRELHDRERTETDEGRERMTAMLDERVKAGEAVWDALRFSLEEITRKGERLDLFLGVENRIYIHEVPTYDEIEKILAAFAGGNFRYWHDVGHATVHQNLGLVDINGVLDRLSKHLIGLHIHDAMGYDDHLAPGQGDTDFASLPPHLNSETIRVIETHPQASEETLLEGVAMLKDVGIIEPAG